MAGFPTSPEQVTSEWLSDVLGRHIRNFEINHFSEGTGVIGQVIRLKVDSEDGGSPSVIDKFPSPVAGNRAVAQTYDMYGREVRFYQEIAGNIRMRTPACHYSAFDPANHDFVILLEDMRAYRIGHQVAGCSLEEAQLVTDALADLHASTWQSPLLDRVVSHDSPMQRNGMIAGFQAGWPVVADLFDDLIPHAAKDVSAKMPARIEELLADMCVEPVCLVHADVRLDNVFFGDGEVVFVDWQAVCSSAPEQDLAYFLTQSVPAEVRSQADLVARYHSALIARGIDYPLDRCRERYRVSALYLLCYAVVIAGTLDMGNERGNALARTLLGGSLNALDEIDAFTLLG